MMAFFLSMLFCVGKFARGHEQQQGFYLANATRIFLGGANPCSPASAHSKLRDAKVNIAVRQEKNLQNY